MPLDLIPPGKRGKYWIVRGTVGGRRFERSTKTLEKVFAEELRIKWEAELQQRRIYGPEATTTFAEAVNLYLGANKSPRHLTPLLDYFGVTLLKDITYARVMEAAQNLYPGRAPATINRQVITPVSAVMRLAHKAGLGPMRTFPRFKEPKGRIRWLHPTEAERLLIACQGHAMLSTTLYLLLGTGMRLSEVLRLTPRDLHLSSRQAFIGENKTDDPRMVRFPSRTAAALAALPTLNEIDLPLIRTQYGEPYTVHGDSGGQIKEPFDAARDRAGLGEDVTPHILRHTWATWQFAAQKDFVKLMALGGWKKAETALRYTKLAPDSLEKDLKAHNWHFSGENWGSEKSSIKKDIKIKGLK